MTSELRSPLDCGISHGSTSNTATASAPNNAVSRPLKRTSREMNLLLVAHILAARDAGREQAVRPPQQHREQQR